MRPTPPALTEPPLDRAAHLREDEGALARMRADPAARTLLFSAGRTLFSVDGEALVAERLALDDPQVEEALDEPVFLGIEEGAPLFALAVPERDSPGETRKFIDLRSALFNSGFGGTEASLVSMAKALIGWHLAHGFCARCGARSAMIQGGWRRDCPACSAQHFPRLDPVVIMVIEREGRVAIARNVNFPGALFSLIAGFVEPGESIEDAVRRETREELGLRVGRVRYLASQPWPFPSSLMLGCIGEALDDAFTLEEAEIAEARWFDRDELAAVFRGEVEGVDPPRRSAIASSLLKDWLEGRIGFGS